MFKIELPTVGDTLTLTKFSDYSLRLLIYLGLHHDRLVSVGEISRAYRVSPHIMVKVVQLLTEQELIASVRGRNGGLRLNKPPAEINVGRLIRRTEAGLGPGRVLRREPGTRARSTAPAASRGR